VTGSKFDLIILGVLCANGGGIFGLKLPGLNNFEVSKLGDQGLSSPGYTKLEVTTLTNLCDKRRGNSVKSWVRKLCLDMEYLYYVHLPVAPIKEHIPTVYSHGTPR